MSKSLLAIFLVVFLDLLGFGIVIPILPFYAEHYGASAWEIGWLMTSYSLMQFIFSPILGRLSDRFGRKPILLFSSLGSAISMTVLGFAHSLFLLFAGRMLAGISAASISTAYAYTADVTTEENRSKGMGLIGAGLGLGFTVGPAIGGLLSKWGFSTPMFFAAGLALFNFFFALAVLKEPKKKVSRQKKKESLHLKQLSAFLKHSEVSIPILLFFLLTLAMTQMEVILAIYLESQYGFLADSTGIFFALFGFIMVITQGGMIGPLTRRFGEIPLILFAALLGAFGFFSLSFPQSIWLFAFFLSLLALSRGILHPCLTSLTSKGASDRQQGTVMGIFHSSGSFARIVGPISAGWLYESMSRQTPFLAASFSLVAIFFVLVVFVTRQRKKKSSHSPSSY